jgi:2'-5' RNA ligase
MIDRWENRAEPAPGEGLIYWHMLMGGYPEVVELARTAQERLSSFGGLHMTPLKWLHVTGLITGSADEISEQQVQEIAEVGTRLLARTPPIRVTFGKVLYHPEAIMLAASPAEALAPVVEAAKAATFEVIGSSGRPGNKLPWAPHITVCYSTSRQDAAPIIGALGRHLPEVPAQIAEVSLVVQQGPERLWGWRPLATVPIGSNLTIIERGAGESVEDS